MTYDAMLDLLLPYVEGILSPEQAAEFEAGLERWPDLAGVVQDLRDFPDLELAPGVEPLSPVEVEEGCERLQPVLEERERRRKPS